jgi:hypothetical protein
LKDKISVYIPSKLPNFERQGSRASRSVPTFQANCRTLKDKISAYFPSNLPKFETMKQSFEISAYFLSKLPNLKDNEAGL